MIRFVQESRKAAGLDVSDRIDLAWSSPDDELARAIETHADFIAGEVLATSMHREATPNRAGAATTRPRSRCAW